MEDLIEIAVPKAGKIYKRSLLRDNYILILAFFDKMMIILENGILIDKFCISQFY